MERLFQRLTFVILWLTIFTIPWQKGLIVPGVGSLNKVLGIVLVVVVVLTVILKGSFKKIPKFYILSAIFLFLNLFSFFWAEVSSEAIEKSVLLLQVLFLSWAIYEFADNKNQLNNLIKAYVLGCAVIALQTIYQYSTGAISASTTRFFIEGYNPNALSIIWAMGLPMAIYLILNREKLFLLYLPVATFAILLSGSRTGLILLTVVVAASVWLLFKYKVKFRRSIILATALLGLFSFQLIPEGQLLRLSTLDNELSSGTLNGRTDIWQAGYEIFASNPLFGVGAGSYSEAVVTGSALTLSASAHNSYLSVLVENGLLGFVVFFTMLFILLVMCLRIKKSDTRRWLSLTLLSMWLVLSLASHAEVQKFTWVVFGIIVTCYYTSKNEQQVEKEVLEPVESKKKKKKMFIKKRLVW